MDGGSGKNSEAEEDRLVERVPSLEEIKDWDASTRRRFLGVLLAALTGILTTTGITIRSMLRHFSSENGDVERPSESEILRGDPPADIYVQEYDEEFRATNNRGETIASGADGWEVLQQAVDAIPAGGRLIVRGRYEADQPIEINKSLQLDGDGAYVLLNGSPEFVFEFAGEQRYQTELTSTVDTGEYTIELDRTEDIQSEDMVLLEESDGEPVLGREQPPGEPHSVLEVDGSTVSLEDTIVWRDGYDSGTLVYVVDPIEVSCSGFELISPAKDTPYTGIMVRDCRDSVFEDLHLKRFGNRGIALEGCANTRVRDTTVLQSADIDSSDGYGIQIRAGCHDIIVEGCTAKECRHPLSVTPAGPREVPSRSIIFRDCFVSADGSAALNCHGGSAHDVRFEGCKVHTRGEAGLRTGAQQTNVSGCEFRMSTHHAITTRNDGQEMVLTVSDTDIYGAGNAVDLDDSGDYDFNPLWKRVHIEGVRAFDCARFFELDSGDVDRVRNLAIRNCSWDTVSATGLRIENRIDGGCIEGNDFGYAPNESHIHARDGDDTSVRNLQITGNRFQKASGTEPFIRLSNTEKCVISDNKFEAENGAEIYADDTGSSHNILRQNTYFAPDASAGAIDADSGSIVEDNHFFDQSTTDWS